MKTSRYTEAQILAILRQAEGGMPVAELCRAQGMNTASFYKWRAKQGGMDAWLISQRKAMDRAIGPPLVQGQGRERTAAEAVVCGPWHAGGSA